jgi:hypothetical protein
VKENKKDFGVWVCFCKGVKGGSTESPREAIEGLFGR